MAEKEYIKPITIKNEDNNEQYTLEFNADTVRFAEQRGFTIDDVSKFPMTKFNELFYYAFRMHHKNLAKANTDKILAELGGLKNLPDGFAERLGELRAQAFESGAEKNPRMTVEF